MKILILFCLIASSFGYKILCVFPAASKSHDNLARGVVKALLNAGHQVTWVTSFEQKNIPANLTVVDVKRDESHIDASAIMTKASISSLRTMRRLTTDICVAANGNKELRRMLIEEQFHAVVTTYIMNDYDGGYAAIQGVPWIVLSTWSYHPLLEWQMDEVRSIPTTPLIFNADASMSFWSRLFNGLAYMAMCVDWWFEQTRLENIYNSMFADLAAARGVPLPPFADIQRNVSILLVNSHESIALPSVKPPNVINIAGYHIDENPLPLPKDLQDLLDNSPQGVIYFSMGSILRSSTSMSGETVTALLGQFAALNQTVLWKFEEDLEELPKNVHVRSWMPQQNILAHPNIRVFITHGGQLSTLEAVQAGVPLLAIPVFGDQHSNAERAKSLGYALTVEFNTGMADEVADKLAELLNNQTYYHRAKYLSKLFNARPERPSKLISHYIELAIESKGAYHLRSLSLQYSWVERWMLDVTLLVLATLAAALTLLKFALRACYRKICRNKCQKEKREKKDTKKKKN